MVARQQLGDIFLGITPSPVRQFMLQQFKDARGHYDKIIIPCAGRFTIAEAAVSAGWLPTQIETSDVSLFSTLLGFACSGQNTDRLEILFSDELLPLCAHAHNEGMAAVTLFAMKLCQLRADRPFERMVVNELNADPRRYIRELHLAIERLKDRLGGLAYEILDVRAHVARYRDDPAALLYINPPGFSKGYTKMFNLGERITWRDPKIPEFDAKTGRLELYRELMDAPPLVYFFRSKAPEDGFEGKSVFAVERNKSRDFVLCNRPEEASKSVRRRTETRIHAAKIPQMPVGYEIRPDSKLQFVVSDIQTALYYRDLFAHKLSVTRAERYYLTVIDGYLMAVFGLFVSDIDRGVRGRIYETFGFCAPIARYPRVNHLFMSALVCEDARKFFTELHGGLLDVTEFQTTCISTTPEQKSHRSTGLKLIEKEKMPDGRFKLVYGGGFKKLSFAETIQAWRRKPGSRWE